MSKISDMIVSAILKRGTLGEFKNFKTEVEIPQENKELIRITIQAENLQIRVEKGEEQNYYAISYYQQKEIHTFISSFCTMHYICSDRIWLPQSNKSITTDTTSSLYYLANT